MPSPPSRTPGKRSAQLAAGRPSRKVRAAEITHREALWYARHVEQRLPLVVTLRDGEELRGVLDWYDQAAYRLALPDGGHVVVQKSAVRTLRPA